MGRHRQRAPELLKPARPFDELIERRADSLCEGAHFTNVVVNKYLWSVRYATDEHLGLLNTYSDHLRLSESRGDELLEGIAELIERHGGYIERPNLAALYLAQRTSA